MNIVLLQNMLYVPSWGGANKGNRELMERLVQAGHRCRAVVPGQSPHGPRSRAEFRAELDRRGLAPVLATEAADIVEVARVQVHAVANPFELAAYARTLLVGERCDCVLVGADDPTHALLDAALAAAPGRVVMLVRTTFYLPFGPAAVLRDAGRAARVAQCRALVANSRHVADYLRRHLPASDAPPEIVALPLPAMGLSTRLEPREAGFGRGFVTMVNPCAIKGLPIFLGLAARFPDVPFAAVPTWGTTPEDLTTLSRLPNVHVLPPADRIETILAQTRALVMPSLWDEAFGRTAVEAMLQSVPVLASDVGGLAEAKLGVPYLLPVRPITTYGPDCDANRLPIPQVPAQDLQPWETALRELLTHAARYAEIARASREAAVSFVSAARFEPIMELLERVAAAPPLSPSPRREPDRRRVADLTPAQRTALALKALAARPGPPRQPETAEAATVPGTTLPATTIQSRLFFLQQAAPASAAYIVPQLIELEGALDRPALQRALDALVARHEALRAIFRPGANGVEQTIAAPTGMPLVQLGADEARLDRELRRPFDLTREPPVRTVLLESPARSRLFLLVHHIACDAQTMRVLVEELCRLYDAFAQGTEPRLPPPRAYATAVRSGVEAETHAATLAAWTARLRGFPLAMNLPHDGQAGAADEAAGRATLELPPGLSAALMDFARRENVTGFMLFLAAFQTLLHHYTGQREVVVGYPADLRRPGFERTAGCFANTLLAAARPGAGGSFRDFLQRTRDDVLAALEQRDVPLDRLLAELRGGSDAGGTASPQVFFAYASQPLEPQTAAGVTFRPLPATPLAAKFELCLFVVESGGRHRCTIEYREGLFTAETIRRWAGHLQHFLAGAAGHPERDLRDLDYLTSPEREQLDAWNATATAYPRERTVLELILAQIARTPDAPAIVASNGRLTYREFGDRAEAIAARLRAHGVRRGDLVAVCLDRTTELVPALAAIFRLGAAYLPLDPAYPADRLGAMLADAAARFVLSDPRQEAAVPATSAQRIRLEPAVHTGVSTRPEGAPEDVAYVLYTSGSTGRPKGVQISQRALVNLLWSMQREPGFTAADRMLAITSLSFDIAGLELWLPLICGGTVLLASAEEARDPALLARAIETRGPTVLQATPAIWSALLETGWAGWRGLRAWCGGERLPGELAAALHARCDQVWNLYGPTETTIWSTAHRIDASVPAPLVGRPIANTRAYVLDERLRAVPVGVTGELYLGGDGVAYGYLGGPELTAQRFLPDPVQPGERCYRTGDRARLRANGEIELLGRADRQVKIRGHRIEPGEIEETLRRHPDVAQAAVVATGSSLVAYVVARNGGADETVLRPFLASRLPPYMVPSVFVRLPVLPLTPNAKVDYRQLATKPREENVTPATAPERPLERELAEIWAAVLRRDTVPVTENFFDLGGHSLLAMSVVARARKALRREIPLATLLENPTVRSWAAALHGETGGDTRSGSLVLLRSGDETPPLFLVHAHSGQPLNYVPLARRLRTRRPVYGFRSRALDAGEEDATLEAIAARYVAEMRALQPEGPYHLGGLCLGGFLAYEMARQLAAAGVAVGFLGIIETAAPRSWGGQRHPVARWGFRMLTRLHYEYNIHFRIAPAERRIRYRDRWQRFCEFVQLRGEPRADTESGSPRSVAAQKAYLRAVYQRAILDYDPPPYAGPAVLFPAATQPWGSRLDRALGWERFVRGGVTVHPIPGHNTTLLVEPNVDVLARHLDSELDQLRSAEQARSASPAACLTG